MNKLLTVIVPIYNVEKYLRRCLDSLVNQDLDLISIILVNDGSYDNSQNIAKEYSDKYGFLLINKVNGGLSDARNYGLKYANTEYITFLDSDDYVEKDYYAKVIKLAKKNDADLIISDIEYFWENNDKKKILKGLSDKNEDIHKSLIMSPLFAWNKIYKKELFDELNLKYPTSMWYEDIPVSLKYFRNAKKVIYYDDIGIHYLQRNSSILGSSNDPRVYHIFDILKLVLKDYIESNTFNLYKDEIEYLFIEQIIWYGGFRFLRNDNYQDLIKKAIDFMQISFPNYKKNIYLKNVNLKNKLFIKTISPKTADIWRKIIK